MSDLNRLNQLLKSKQEARSKATDNETQIKLTEEIETIRKEISRQQRIAWEERHERLDWD
jgi:hypothetical protein